MGNIVRRYFLESSLVSDDLEYLAGPFNLQVLTDFLLLYPCRQPNVARPGL